MKILGIETSCDETACAIVEDGEKILSNVIFSSVDQHQLFGGVVPEIAFRSHIEQIIPTIDQALKIAQVSLSEIDLIAATYGPGLMGALQVGLNTAKSLALALNKPFVAINHLEAHLCAAVMNKSLTNIFPAIGLLISGGHTALLYMQDICNYKLIGQTVDDAIGEAFDKVARLLDLSYPGGPEIEKLARQPAQQKFPFKPGLVKGDSFAFSFSGLKTAVLYKLQELTQNGLLSPQNKIDIAQSFQDAAFKDIIDKTLKATGKFSVNNILFGGGVSNSQTLREKFNQAKGSNVLHWPDPDLSLDNGAMIAALAYHKYSLNPKSDRLSCPPSPRIRLL